MCNGPSCINSINVKHFNQERADLTWSLVNGFLTWGVRRWHFLVFQRWRLEPEEVGIIPWFQHSTSPSLTVTSKGQRSLSVYSSETTSRHYVLLGVIPAQIAISKGFNPAINSQKSELRYKNSFRHLPGVSGGPRAAEEENGHRLQKAFQEFPG